MVKYFAFLRAINVGGNTVVKMDELRKIFESLKFTNVKTYIQTGNVIFESNEKNSEKLTKQIESVLFKKFKQEIKTFVRSLDEIKKSNSENPFKKEKPDEKYYVMFTDGSKHLSKGYVSPKKDFEIAKIVGNDLFVICRPVNGKYTYGTAMESTLKIKATTRNLNTLAKILEI